jgi:hypothetical protein
VKLLAHLLWLPVLAVAANAQSTVSAAQVRNLVVHEDKGGATIEVELTFAVTPHLLFLTGPDRLILELPDTEPGKEPSPITVRRNGVNVVRLESDSHANTRMTRVVVILSEARPYGLATNGNKIVLSVLPAVESKARTGPVAGASAPLIGRLHHPAQETGGSTSSPDQSTVLTTPPALPPISLAQESQGATPNSAQNPSASRAPREAGQAEAAAGNSFPSQSVAEQNISAQPSTTEAVAPVHGSGQDSAPAPAAPAVAQEPGTPDIYSADIQGALSQANPDVRIAFRVKYVAEGVAYLDGGSNDGLTEGMKLVVKAMDPSQKPTAVPSADAQPIADLEVASVALSSAVSEIRNPTRPVKVGDWAYLSPEDTQALIAKRSLSATRKYPVVVAFSEGDTLDDEVRVIIPRPPSPEINRARGRIGLDYSGIASHGAGGGLSSSAGLLIRADITRINGTYWNLNGFWRGRINHQSYGGPAPTTLQDLINRTYTLAMTYDNPHSNWVAGFGRLYLPWATSLDALDGGYFGRRFAHGVTAGVFGGSSPDPTSWSYDPSRLLGGAFINFEGGSFDHLHYTSTSGAGVSLLKWNIDRPFIFFENGIFYKHYLSIYDSLQVDSPSGNPAVPAPGVGIGRSFLTVRLQPISRVELDVNHTYFRDIPTYDPSLIGTGLLDKYLFQGLSGGVRVQVTNNLWLYTTLGRSNRTGDAQSSWNQLYGVTLGRLPRLGVRTDVHYSKFNSAFGSGSYQSVSFSRNFNESLRWELLAGRQSFASPTSNDTAHFVTGNFEAALGAHYFLQTGYTWNRGSHNYDQWLFTFGYRFDSHSRRK